MHAVRCLACVALVVLGGRARAAELVEVRSVVELRDYPSAYAGEVGRVVAGATLRVLDQSSDGAWLRVRLRNGREGWLRVSGTRKLEDGVAASPTLRRAAHVTRALEQRAPRAAPEGTHGKEENGRAVVIARAASVLGRPDPDGTPLTEVLSGDVVQVSRRSADGQWAHVDLRGGEAGWIEVRSLRIHRPEDARVDADVRPEPRRGDPASRLIARADTDDDRAEVRVTERHDDDERPPSRPSEPERPRREEEPARRAPAASRTLDATTEAAHGANHVDARVRIGFAVAAERVRTNGTSSTLLGNYEHSTTHVAIGAQLGYSRAWNELRLHLDARFLAAFAGSASIDVGGAAPVPLKVVSENVAAGVAIGGFWRAAGGVDLRLRLGVDAWIHQIEGSVAPLSLAANTVVGMTIGVELAFPQLVRLAHRPLGIRLKGGALAPATRIQRTSLQTAPHETTTGGYVGVAVQYGLFAVPRRGQLHLEVSYDASLAFSHFFGPCPPSTSEAARVCRDDTVDDANYRSAMHVGSIGLYYQY